MSFWKTLFASVPSVNVTELQTRLNEKPGPFLLDVRTPAEYRQGHIPGATSFPLDKLNGRLPKLAKEREIVCICRSGSRSKRATRRLQAAGYTAVNMKGGMNAWQRAGHQIKTGKIK